MPLLVQRSGADSATFNSALLQKIQLDNLNGIFSSSSSSSSSSSFFFLLSFGASQRKWRRKKERERKKEEKNPTKNSRHPSKRKRWKNHKNGGVRGRGGFTHTTCYSDIFQLVGDDFQHFLMGFFYFSLLDQSGSFDCVETVWRRR